MNYLNVNYCKIGFELSYSSTKFSNQISCPSFRKPQGYECLVSTTEFDDGINFILRYSKSINKQFNTKEEAISHFILNYKGKDILYFSELEKVITYDENAIISKINFQWVENIGFGTNIKNLPTGDNLAEKLKCALELSYENI